MTKRISINVRGFLGKARAAALAAVANYNNPYSTFRSGAFLVHMQIAWTALFLAILLRARKKPYYKAKDGQYQRIGGTPKHWDLMKCLTEYFGSGVTTPVTQNLVFMSGLRDRVEHAEMPQLDMYIFGECQANLMNFEELLVKEFGEQFAINESLTLALQFSKFRDPASTSAARKLHEPLMSDVRSYISTFRSALTDDIASSQEFSFKVFLLPNIGTNRKRDSIAIEWVHFDPNSEEQEESIAALIKVKQIPIVRSDLMKPTSVCQLVAQRIAPKSFGTNIHRACARHYGALPADDNPDPNGTNPEFCVFEPLNRNYGYTAAWVDFLVKKMSEDVEYERMRSTLRGRGKLQRQRSKGLFRDRPE